MDLVKTIAFENESESRKRKNENETSFSISNSFVSVRFFFLTFLDVDNSFLMKKTLKKSITKYLKDNFDLLFIIAYYEKFIECSFLCYKKCDSRLHDMM